LHDKATIACSLGEGDYRHRLEDLRHLGELALLGVQDRTDGVVLSLRNTNRVRQQLMSLVGAEEACCPFLPLSIDANDDELALTITAPPDALPIVRNLVGGFQG
jgi:hypothetical protein